MSDYLSTLNDIESGLAEQESLPPVAINNQDLILPFVPDTNDGDSFIYTELLNRSKKSGNNKGRLYRTFYHRYKEEFLSQMPDIIDLCNYTGARAYTRLSLRSFKKVGHKFFQHMTEQVLAENWEGIRHGYSHACGISSPLKKYWLFDVDLMAIQLPEIVSHTSYVCTIPSKKGYHLITKPFDIRYLALPDQVSLHKDNPTNLYIP